MEKENEEPEKTKKKKPKKPNVHTLTDLRQMQSLSLQSKINMTKQRIQAWYEHFDGAVYVSFSGGKDSTVLLHLVREMYSDVPAVFCNTGLEYPEIVKFAKEQSNIEFVRPETSFPRIIDRYGYPIISKDAAKTINEAKRGIASGGECCQRAIKKMKGEIKNPKGEKSQFNYEKWAFVLDAPFDVSHKCCIINKEKPLNEYSKRTGRKAILGTMTEESRNRSMSWLKHGCNAWEAREQKSTPMAFWTENDVLLYLKERGIPYASVYGDIVESEELPGQMWIPGYNPPNLTTTKCKRTGCIFCGFGCQLEKGKNRYQMLKETHPALYDYCIRDTTLISKRTGKPHPDIGSCKNNKQRNMLVAQTRERLGKRFKTYYETKSGLGFGQVLDYIGVPYK